MALTESQLRMRMTGVTASEIAAVAGVSPYRDKFDVYLGKVGVSPPTEHSEAMKRGTYLESAIVAWAGDELGRHVSKAGRRQETVRHCEHPLVIATPDGLVHRGGKDTAPEAVLEAKSISWRSAYRWGEPGTDQVDDIYIPQVTWQMAATGLDHAIVAALLGDQLALYRVDYDAGLFEVLLDEAQRFWRNHVVPRKAPLPTGKPAHADYIAAQFPRSSGEVLEADLETIGEIERYRLAAERAKEAAAEVEARKQILQQRIGHADGVTGPTGRVTWRVVKGRQRVDWEALAKELGATDEHIRAHTTRGNGYRRFVASFP